MQGANVAGFKSWIGESRKVEPLTGTRTCSATAA